MIFYKYVLVQLTAEVEFENVVTDHSRTIKLEETICDFAFTSISMPSITTYFIFKSMLDLSNL